MRCVVEEASQIARHMARQVATWHMVGEFEFASSWWTAWWTVDPRGWGLGFFFWDFFFAS